MLAVADTRRGTVYGFAADGQVIPVGKRTPYPAQCGLLLDVPIDLDGPALSVAGHLAELSGPFSEIAFFHDNILAVVESAPGVVETVFGIDEAGRPRWRIQPPEHPERFGGLSPYVGVDFSNGHVTVNDFWCREFVLDPTNGRVTSGVIAVYK